MLVSELGGQKIMHCFTKASIKNSPPLRKRFLCIYIKSGVIPAHFCI